MQVKRLIYFVLFTLAANACLYGQSIFMGARDNQFVQLGFIGKQNWFVVAETSVFISKVKNQTFNGYAGYKGGISRLSYMFSVYGGFHYKRLYKSLGGMIELGYDILPWMKISAGLRPHYDSGYRFEAAYKGCIDFKVHKNISLSAEYSNYPEYRNCESRVKAGVSFSVKNLSVKPEISIPTDRNMENMRLLLSFGYRLGM